MTMMCIAGYAMSAAPVVWILCSEIQPLKCRDFGITCSTTTNWVSNMIIGATFLTLLDSIGAAGTFWLYTALNIAFIGITFWLIPETKNVTRAYRTQANGGREAKKYWRVIPLPCRITPVIRHDEK